VRGGFHPVSNSIVAAIANNRSLAMLHVASAAPAYSPADVASCRILLDAYDLSTLFQDAAGATPVTASGQTVGRWVSGTTHATTFNQATAINRPVYTVAGSERYILFNGSNTWLESSAFGWVSPRFTVVAAVRKLSDAAIGMIAAHGNYNVGNAGTFAMYAPSSLGGNQWAGLSRGNTTVQVTASPFVSPISSQVTLIGRNVSGNLLAQIRVNGVSLGSSTASQGVVQNYGNWPMFIGRLAGTSLPLNGRIYRIAMFTEDLTGNDLANAEAWAAEAIT
jgi:hypothetical protein